MKHQHPSFENVKKNLPANTYFNESMSKQLSAVTSLITIRWEMHPLFGFKALPLFIFGNLAGNTTIELYHSLLAMGFGLLAGAMACVLNDITDVDVDCVSHPNRPLPSGKVTMKQAYAFVVICLIGMMACGLLLLQPFPFSIVRYSALLLHITASLAYSLPYFRWGRHWIGGPITLSMAAASGCFLMLVVSDLPRAHLLCPFIGMVFFLQRVLVAPLKDFRDLEGDRADGGTSLAMKLPERVIVLMAMMGYILPYIMLHYGTPHIVSEPLIISSLTSLAIVFSTGGFIMGWVVLLNFELLLQSQRFCWFAELGFALMFSFSLPLAVLWEMNR